MSHRIQESRGSYSEPLLLSLSWEGGSFEEHNINNIHMILRSSPCSLPKGNGNTVFSNTVVVSNILSHGQMQAFSITYVQCAPSHYVVTLAVGQDTFSVFYVVLGF